MRMRAAFALPAAAVAAFFMLAGSGLAANTVSINGTLANGGCGPVKSLSVAGNQRIVVQVSSTSAETGPASTGTVYVQFLSSSGAVVASGPSEYTAPGSGNYGVRVCSVMNNDNPAQLQYSGNISLLAPGTVVSVATGKAGIRSHSTMVWFTVSATRAHASMRVDDALHKVHLGASTGLKAVLSVNKVTIAGKGMTLIIMGHGVQQHIVFHSRDYSASGLVARGAITIA